MPRVCNSSEDSLPPSCFYREEGNMSVHDIFGSLSPNCRTGAWDSITVSWLVGYYLYVVIFAVLFLLLGVASIIFLCKRHLAQRFKAKTFIAIDVALAILGISKFLYLVVEPPIQNYCEGHVACIWVLRMLFALHFPSLTAAYTLVFLTLWSSAEMKLGTACIQRWKIIIPLCFIHYIVAISFEVVGLTIGQIHPTPVIFLLITCEAVFIIWGLLVCLTFLIAGIRLLHSMKNAVRQSSVVAKDTQKNGSQQMKSGTTTTIRMRRKRQQKQTIRKISIITYCAAVLGFVYSLLGITLVVMMCLMLFGECDEEKMQNSTIWLSLKYLGTTIELVLGLLLLYSINDIRPIVIIMKNLALCVIHCQKVSDKNQNSTKKRPSYLFSYEHSSESNRGFSSIIRKLTSNDLTITAIPDKNMSPSHFKSSPPIPENIEPPNNSQELKENNIHVATSQNNEEQITEINDHKNRNHVNFQEKMQDTII